MATLSALAKAAKARLMEKQELKTQKVYSAALDADLTFHALNNEEWGRIYGNTKMSSLEQANKIIYLACDQLPKIANELYEAGVLKDHWDICDLFLQVDKNALLQRIMEMSGLKGDSELVFSDELVAVKN